MIVELLTFILRFEKNERDKNYANNRIQNTQIFQVFFFLLSTGTFASIAISEGSKATKTLHKSNFYIIFAFPFFRLFQPDTLWQQLSWRFSSLWLQKSPHLNVFSRAISRRKQKLFISAQNFNFFCFSRWLETTFFLSTTPTFSSFISQH